MKIPGDAYRTLGMVANVVMKHAVINIISWAASGLLNLNRERTDAGWFVDRELPAGVHVRVVGSCSPFSGME